jgi:hypothetical protein
MRRGPNNAYFVSIPQVGVDHLRRAGMDLDVQTTDFTTMLPRRISPGFRRTKVAEHLWGNYGNAALLSYPACGLAAPLSALCCEGSAILHRLSGPTLSHPRLKPMPRLRFRRRLTRRAQR